MLKDRTTPGPGAVTSENVRVIVCNTFKCSGFEIFRKSNLTIDIDRIYQMMGNLGSASAPKVWVLHLFWAFREKVDIWHNQCQTFLHTLTLFCKGSRPKKRIADLETLSQLALPVPPLSMIETSLIETFWIFGDPSPPSLQLRHIIFGIPKRLPIVCRTTHFETVFFKKNLRAPPQIHFIKTKFRKNCKNIW